MRELWEFCLLKLYLTYAVSSGLWPKTWRNLDLLKWNINCKHIGFPFICMLMIYFYFKLLAKSVKLQVCSSLFYWKIKLIFFETFSCYYIYRTFLTILKSKWWLISKKKLKVINYDVSCSQILCYNYNLHWVIYNSTYMKHTYMCEINLKI